MRIVDTQLRVPKQLSGIEAKDINIEATSEDIVITAETEHRHNEQKGTVHYCEFQSGKLFRAIHLPKKIDPDKVKAEFKNGLLRLTADIAAEARKTIKPEAA